MDFETVYAKGYNAGYWRVMNGYKGEFSYEDVYKRQSFSSLKSLEKLLEIPSTPDS